MAQTIRDRQAAILTFFDNDGCHELRSNPSWARISECNSLARAGLLVADSDTYRWEITYGGIEALAGWQAENDGAM